MCRGTVKSDCKVRKSCSKMPSFVATSKQTTFVQFLSCNSMIGEQCRISYLYVCLCRSHAHSNACGCLTTIRRLLFESMHQLLQAPQTQNRLQKCLLSTPTYQFVRTHDSCMLALPSSVTRSLLHILWQRHVRGIM